MAAGSQTEVKPLEAQEPKGIPEQPESKPAGSSFDMASESLSEGNSSEIQESNGSPKLHQPETETESADSSSDVAPERQIEAKPFEAQEFNGSPAPQLPEGERGPATAAQPEGQRAHPSRASENQWTLEGIRALLSVWGSHDIQGMIKAKKRLRNIYQAICRRLRDRGVQQSWQECRSLMRSLQETYKTFSEANWRPGAQPLPCPFQKELDAIFSRSAAPEEGPGFWQPPPTGDCNVQAPVWAHPWYGQSQMPTQGIQWDPSMAMTHEVPWNGTRPKDAGWNLALQTQFPYFQPPQAHLGFQQNPLPPCPLLPYPLPYLTTYPTVYPPHQPLYPQMSGIHFLTGYQRL